MLVVFALVQALGAAEPAAKAPAGPTMTIGQAADAARLKGCAAMVDQDAEKAYEEAMAWARATQTKEAYLCAAYADIGRGRPAAGAKRLEFLAMPGTATDKDRIEMLSKAGNAWLLAGDGVEAAKDFGKALQLAPNEPDLRIDRARAYALAKDWKAAEGDLTAALALRPNDPLALRLRAETRLRQSVFDLAEKDAADAVALEPKNVDALVALGRAREAKRLGRPPED